LDGPVLCASVKADLLRDTSSSASTAATSVVFDPTGATAMPSDGWSPLVGCAHWHGALRVAQWLCTATHTGGTGGDLDFWYRRRKKLLAPLLFAAASSGRCMADVVRWVDHQTADEVDELLAVAACEEALDAGTARELRDPKQRSSIYTTLETVLDAYQDPRVLRDAERTGISPSRLLDGGQSALYLCSPADDQDALRPVFSTLILSITTAVYAQVTSTGKPSGPAAAARSRRTGECRARPRLDVLASTGRDQGIQQLAILQDFSQLESATAPDEPERSSTTTTPSSCSPARAIKRRSTSSASSSETRSSSSTRQPLPNSTRHARHRRPSADSRRPTPRVNSAAAGASSSTAISRRRTSSCSRGSGSARQAEFDGPRAPTQPTRCERYPPSIGGASADRVDAHGPACEDEPRKTSWPPAVKAAGRVA
jgi:hypothetical protein